MKILALGGDGIGPEVTAAGLRVLERVAQREGLGLDIEEDLIGGATYDRYGTFCRDRTVTAAHRADAVLAGSVGGPKWDALEIEGTPADKDGLMRLRQELDVFAGLRPARAYKALASALPFKEALVGGADVMVLRELCGGFFFSEPRGIDVLEEGGFRGYDTSVYTSAEIERVARVGFELARRRRGKLASVDKANVMESGVLWRRTVAALGADDYPDVALRHLFADNALFQLVRAPQDFDVILADNLFGDLISDLTGSFAGSLGMLPSASLPGLAPEGERIKPAIYEPVHGSAPDIVGQGVANPIGSILSVAMMLDYGFARPDLARRVEGAVEQVFSDGVLPPDLGGTAGTADVTDAVIKALD